MAVFALQAILIVTHEPFVDEWQALQIAVQSPDFGALLANLRYEGHPPLWYLVLRAFSEIVGPHNALVAANLLLALSIQFLILFRSPFPLWLRLALALSEPILFEYGTISRSYTLGVALTFWALAAWPSRRLFWIPVALLPAVDFLFGVISIALLLLRLGDRKLWLLGLGCWFVIACLSALTVIPAADFVPVYHMAQEPLVDFAYWLARLSIVLLPLQWPKWDDLPPFNLFVILWLPFLLLCLDQTRGRPLDRVALAGFLLCFLVLCTFFYSMGNRHLMLIGILIVALQWRQSLHGNAIRWPFKAWAAVGAGCGLATAAISFAMPFDSAGTAAAIIRARGLEREHWVAAPAQHAQGISAMTGIAFEGAGLNCMHDFIRWNFVPQVRSAAQLGDWVTRESQREGRFYLISETALPEGAPARPIAHVPSGYVGKAYHLYAIRPDALHARGDRPRCVPDMSAFPRHPSHRR